ncbi:hypothetical protein BIWAKO_00979 [Bosea sp. BIWAKO-01]|nr:hypothetical protein BIWAKO_00979 [Bosea sp. BIWAKO-01]
MPGVCLKGRHTPNGMQNASKPREFSLGCETEAVGRILYN